MEEKGRSFLGALFNSASPVKTESNVDGALLSSQSFSDLEGFLKNPNDSNSYPSGNFHSFSQGSIKSYRGDAWEEGHIYRLVAGRLDILTEGDKARFWLVLAHKNGYIFSPVFTGLLTKSDEGGLSCGVLVEEWREVKSIYDCVKHLLDKNGNLREGLLGSNYLEGEFIKKLKPSSFLEHIRSEILYMDPPGSFDCEALERDALTLKVLTAKLLIHEGRKPESYTEECAAEADMLAEKLRQACHKRMENYAIAKEGGVKPKRNIQEELSYLKEIDIWHTTVARISRTRHNFPHIDVDLFPPLEDTTFGFLMDSSLVKRRMHLKPMVKDYVGETSHPLNF